MITVERRVPVHGDGNDPLRGLSDFAGAVDWFPDVRSSTQLNDDAPGPGTSWSVVSVRQGRHTEWTYTLDHREVDRVVFVGEGPVGTAIDEICICRGREGDVLVYRACLRLRGAARLATLVTTRSFRRLVDERARGLAVAVSRSRP